LFRQEPLFGRGDLVAQVPNKIAQALEGSRHLRRPALQA
jgi:hypothetical protein